MLPPPCALPKVLEAKTSNHETATMAVATGRYTLSGWAAHGLTVGMRGCWLYVVGTDRPGDYATAVTQFSMAIRLDKYNYVMWSNRSAALCGVGNWDKALSDAERCIKLAPTWGKGFARKGAALVGLGQGGEALKVYLAGLKVRAHCPSCHSA
jgi:hypothetical protein